MGDLSFAERSLLDKLRSDLAAQSDSKSDGVALPPGKVWYPIGLDRDPPPPNEFAEVPDRDSIDELSDRVITNTMPTVNDWVEEVKGLVDNAESLEQARDRIFGLYGDLDAQAFGEKLAQGMAIAELIGRYEVLEETGNLDNSETADFAKAKAIGGKAKNCTEKSLSCGYTCLPKLTVIWISLALLCAGGDFKLSVPN
jgi:hypothetical protein